MRRASRTVLSLLTLTNMKVTMHFKALVVALSVIAAHAPCSAQELEKNGMPCIAEICIGDGIAQLSKIQWTPAQNPIKLANKVQLTSAHVLNDDDMRALKAVFPAASEAAPYLHERQFDSNALLGLARITAACQANELVGSFGKDGNTPTKVRISLLPSAASSAQQAWTVTSIVREFPSALSDAERAQINKVLSQKYAKFAGGAGLDDNAKPGQGYYSPSVTAHFGFGLSLSRAIDESARMKLNPACGGGQVSAAKPAL